MFRGSVLHHLRWEGFSVLFPIKDKWTPLLARSVWFRICRMLSQKYPVFLWFIASVKQSTCWGTSEIFWGWSSEETASSFLGNKETKGPFLRAQERLLHHELQAVQNLRQAEF